MPYFEYLNFLWILLIHDRNRLRPRFLRTITTLNYSLLLNPLRLQALRAKCQRRKHRALAAAGVAEGQDYCFVLKIPIRLLLEHAIQDDDYVS